MKVAIALGLTALLLLAACRGTKGPPQQDTPTNEAAAASQ